MKTVKDVIDRKAGTVSVSDDEIMSYVIENKNILVTKDRGLKVQCHQAGIPFVKLGSREQEARIVDTNLRDMLVWKGYL